MNKPHLQIALALIWRGDQILVTKRRVDADHLAGFWEFPGGKLKTGESLEACAIREAREEVGLEVEVLKARPVIEWDYPERLVSLHPFDCRTVSGEPAPLEVAEWKWATPSRLKIEEFPPANAGLIEELVKG